MIRERDTQSRQSWMLLGALFLAHFLSAADRLVIGLMVEPIKLDLGITDTEVSLLQGLAFFLLYSIVGLPMGMLADRLSRVRLVSVGIGFWSVMAAGCGLAGNLAQLALARVGVGIGEATLSPAAHSLIIDSFPPRRHALTLGIFALGGIIGGAASLAAGGYLLVYLTTHGAIDLPILRDLAPWQATFVLVASPGFILVALLRLFAEPPRSRAHQEVRREESRGVFLFYRNNWRAIVPHHLGIAFCMSAVISIVLWSAPFFIRVHGWPVEQAGLWSGVANLASGLVGLAAGGALSDRLIRYGVKGRLLLCALGMPVGFVAVVIFATAGGAVAVPALAVFLSCCLLPYGVAGAALQSVAPPHARGTVAAVFLLVSSMPTAIAPTVIALLSDNVFPWPAGLRYSMLCYGAAATTLAGICFLLAIRPFDRLARNSATAAPGTLVMANA